MEETKTVTPMEGLNIAADTLGKISIPAELIEQIGLPLARSINLLKGCIDVLANCDIIPKGNEPQQEEIEMGNINLGEDEPDA